MPRRSGALSHDGVDRQGWLPCGCHRGQLQRASGLADHGKRPLNAALPEPVEAVTPFRDALRASLSQEPGIMGTSGRQVVAPTGFVGR
jgi:hypothetical protein